MDRPEQLRLRPAVVADCDFIARALHATAGGIYEYLWADRLNDEEIFTMLVSYLRQADHYDSYGSVTIAEWAGVPIGMVSAYSSSYQGIDDEMRKLFAPDKLEALREFFCTTVTDSLYINAIYVDPSFRGRRVAGQLLAAARQRGAGENYCGLSLLVMTHNAAAIRAYEQSGMRILRNISFSGHPLMPECAGFYLMADAACGEIVQSC